MRKLLIIVGLFSALSSFGQTHYGNPMDGNYNFKDSVTVDSALYINGLTNASSVGATAVVGIDTATRGLSRLTNTQFCDKVNACVTVPTVTYGTYSPVDSARFNIMVVSFSTATYFRSGNQVTVGGEFTVTNTTGGYSSFEINLPIASTLTNSYSLFGRGTSKSIYSSVDMALPAIITGDSNHKAMIEILQNPETLSDAVFTYSFSYPITP